METYTLILNTSQPKNITYNNGNGVRNDITYYIDWNFLPDEYTDYEVKCDFQTTITTAGFATYYLNINMGSNNKYSQIQTQTPLTGTIQTYQYGLRQAPMNLDMTLYAQPYMMQKPSTNYIRVYTTTQDGKSLQPPNLLNYVLVLTFTPVKTK